jgi:hypothetical protein
LRGLPGDRSFRYSIDGSDHGIADLKVEELVWPLSGKHYPKHLHSPVQPLHELEPARRLAVEDMHVGEVDETKE